jgi:hypothetical protein
MTPTDGGKPLGPIPRGIEVLVKKAAVDAEFKRLLLEKRAEAAKEIGLTLEPAEAQMLAAAPREQLEAIIARTTVAPSLRPVFLGGAAAVMLAALGAGIVIAGKDFVDWESHSYGITKDRPDATSPYEMEVAAAPAPTPTAAKPTPTAPAATPTAAKPAAPAAVSEADAKAIEEQVTKQYRQAITDLAVSHGVPGRTVRIFVWLDDGGNVTSCQFANPGEAGPVGFRDQTSGLIMKWKFPDVKTAGIATIVMETPKQLPATQERPRTIVIAGNLAMPAEAQPAVVAPGDVKVLPGHVRAPSGEAAPTTTTAPAPTPTSAPNTYTGRTMISAGILIVSPPLPPQNRKED